MTAEPLGARSRTGYDAATLETLTADAEQIKARYPDERSGLLPMLHLVQSVEGYVSRDGIVFCAEQLGLTAAEVSAVATFYTQYKRHPNGDYTVGVCTNTLCAVMGGDAIFDRLSQHLDVGHDETTSDGSITLERVECNAACDYAPVVMVNWEFFDNQTPESATDLTDRLRAGDDVAPTRGAASVCSFKAMSRVLAGFPDGRADEGVGAGEATLAGLRLARAAAAVDEMEGSGTAEVEDSSSAGPAEAEVSSSPGDHPAARSSQPPARPGQPGDEETSTSTFAAGSGPSGGIQDDGGAPDDDGGSDDGGRSGGAATGSGADVAPETGGEQSSAERTEAAPEDDEPGRSPAGGKPNPEPEKGGDDD